LVLAPLLFALAFRRNPHWRGAWLPSLLTLPAIIVANAVFSAVGDGAARRAGTVVAFAWFTCGGAWLLRESSRPVMPLRDLPDYDKSFSASHALATRFCARVSHASATRSWSSPRSRRARLGMRTSTAA
jgi:hypothetical protein